VIVLDILYKNGDSSLFSDGQLVTIKPGGSVWGPGEIAPGYLFVSLTVEQGVAEAVINDILAFKVNNTAAPTSIVPV
jgi:hypothetical protein